MRIMHDRRHSGSWWQARDPSVNGGERFTACVAGEHRQGEHNSVITTSTRRALGSRARAVVALVAVAFIAVVAPACGDSSAREPTGLDSGHSSARGVGSAHASTATGGVEDRSSVAPAVVRTQLEALMRRYDKATGALLITPSDAADATAATTKAYLSIFAPGSSFASGALAFWAREAAQGHAFRPGSRGQILTTQVTSVEPVSANTVDFDVCVASSFVLVDTAGQILESRGGVEAGRGVALLVDGQWLLRDLSFTASSECSQPTGKS